MASADDVPIVDTPNGVRVSLEKLYLYPDGHANLTFAAVPEEGLRGAPRPAVVAVDGRTVVAPPVVPLGQREY